MVTKQTGVRRSAVVGYLLAVMCAGLAGGCRQTSELERLTEARRLASNLLVDFTRGADAANRAVMAEADDASASFALEARQATDAAERARDSLRPLLAGPGYGREAGILAEFDARFREYRALEREILALAVENTNLKAQRLSVGPAGRHADALGESLAQVVASTRGGDAWQVRALAAEALAGVRDVQALHAPHIAEPDDAPMTRIEARMTGSLAQARRAIDALRPLVTAQGRPHLAAAAEALEQFAAVNVEILALSRRNSDVRALALSLGRKRTLSAACEERLRALQDALSARGFPGTR